MRFSAYEVHLCTGELFRAGRKIKLQVQPFHVLAMLLEHPREVMAREELQKRLWPADIFVDFDRSPNTAIKKLRQALSDDKRKPRFIETLPKRGYRFIGVVARPRRTLAQAPSHLPPAAKTASSWIECVAKLCSEEKTAYVLVSVDEESAAEREKLGAANDDVGLSLLIVAQKLFLVLNGTPVRILEVQETASRFLGRILEGEHYGKTALMPLKWVTRPA